MSQEPATTEFHPSRTQLIEFAEGKSDEESAQSIEAHLESCVTCLAVIDQISLGADSFVAKLRNHDAAPGASNASPNYSPTEDLGQRTKNKVPKKTDLPDHPDYEITSEIARGGMGRVLAGKEIALNREVAIKTLLPGRDATRFVTEAEITARLPHPGIPPVHRLGLLEDNSPFLAMKFVKGRTLADALHARRDLSDDLLRFVQVFQQIAHAVGFAHAQGIIHRDLKPSNVMIGGFGEVHVMDWGLARELGKESSAPEQSDGSASVLGRRKTRAGAVMGTPSYMAPEQAKGDEVDARADVFALGGILAAILTGQPPFRGKDATEITIKAAAADTTEIENLLQSNAADRELVEIALQCLKVEPEQRPTSAKEVASMVAEYLENVDRRLRQAEADRAASQAEAREQRKRRRAMRIAGGIIFVVLTLGIIGTSWALNEKTKEFDRAEDALLDVRRSIDQYVEVVENEELLKHPQFKEVIPKLLAFALEQYEAYVEEHAGSQDAETRAQVAQSFFEIGRIFAISGNLEQSLEAWKQALAIQEDLARENTNVNQHVEKAAMCHHGIGKAYGILGQNGSAIESMLEAIKLWKHLSDEWPALTRYRSELARSENGLGVLYYEIGQLEQAEEFYKSALKTREKLTAEDPTVPQLQRDLAESYNNLGGVCSAVGRVEEAKQYYTSAMDIYKRYADDNPTVKQYRIDLADVYNDLGAVFKQTGNNSQALGAYHKALKVREQLARENPAFPDLRAALGDSYFNLGILHRSNSDIAKALDASTRALEIRNQLVSEHPAVVEYRSGLAAIFLNLGNLHRDDGDYEKALESYTHALEIRRRLIDENPKVVAFQSGLSGVYNSVGNLHRDNADYEEALESYTHAIEIRRRLVDENPKTIPYHSDLAASLVGLGNLYSIQEDSEKALVTYKEAQNIQIAISSRQPEVVEYQLDLAKSCQNIGITYAIAGDLDRAIKATLQEQQIREGIARDNQSVIQNHIDLAQCYTYLSVLYQNKGESLQAVVSYNQALEIWHRLADENHTVTKFRLALAKTEYDLGILLFKLGNLEEAIEVIARELAIRKRLALEEPATTQFQADLARSYVALGELSTKAGKNEVAVESYRNATRAISLASAAAAVDDSLSQDDRDALQDQYASRAVKMLTTLAEQDYFAGRENRKLLNEDTDLDPLRDREDFKELLRKLGEAKDTDGGGQDDMSPQQAKPAA